MTNPPELRRRRELGEVISESFSLTQALFPILAAVVAPTVLIEIAIGLVSLLFENDSAALLWFFASLPISVVASQLVSAAAIVVIEGHGRRERIGSGDALDAAQNRFGDVASAALRSTAIIFGLCFTLIGIPWAINRAVRWAFIVQALMLDGQNSETALDYSSNLVKGSWWPTAGRLIACFLVIGFPMLILSQLLLSAAPGVAGTVLSGMTSFITTPFTIAATTLIFYDLKVRKNDMAITPTGGAE